MSVTPGIPIHQIIKGPDRDYTIANILNAFVRGEVVKVYSFDGVSLTVNEIDHIARRGLEYMFQIIDTEEGFFTCSASQKVLTQDGLVPAKDLSAESKLIKPAEVGRAKQTEIKTRRVVPRRTADPTEDERDYVYAIRFAKEPYNVFTGRAVLEAEKAEEAE